jgi:predicted chitinase
MTYQQAGSRLRESDVRKKLRRLICEFRTEWDAANFDSSYAFLLKDGTWGDGTHRAAMTPEQYADFKAHANALQWWADARLGLPATVWHFHPIEFIDWMSSCRWIDKSTLSKIYVKTPESIRERYRTALNKVMQKYIFVDAIRQAHFLGQGAIESGGLKNMQEASMLHDKLNPASVESEATLGHWYGKESSEFDDYYSSEKFNSKGKRITGSYSWVNGNVGDVDAQEFRGRGFKQLTGRANYAAYWLYRGWLKKTDFDDSWWLDPEYKLHNEKKMKKRPAVIDEPDRIIRDPYNCIDSGGFFVTIKNDRVKPEIDASRGIVPISDQEKEDEKKISAAVTHVINGGYIAKDERYISTIDALKVLN